jgi:CheY-like chemotaxis protein
MLIAQRLEPETEGAVAPSGGTPWGDKMLMAIGAGLVVLLALHVTLTYKPWIQFLLLLAVAFHAALGLRVILLDLNLPKVSGFDVLDRIKTSDKLSSTPVIVLTVSERQEDIARAYQLGANTYITKPVAFDEFTHTIDTLWEYWMVIAKLPLQAA